MATSRATATKARQVWKGLWEAVKYQGEQVVLTSNGRPAGGLVPEAVWRQRAGAVGLDPNDVTYVGVIDGRDKLNALLGRAKAGKGTLLVFHPDVADPEVLAVVVPWTVLDVPAEEVAALPEFSADAA